MKKLKQILLIPVVILAAAWSWLTHLLFGVPKDKPADWMKDLWGWTSPAMSQHWNDFFNDTEGRGWFHEAKNLASEWNRLDAQRAAKAGCFLLVVTNLIWAVALAVVAGVYVF